MFVLDINIDVALVPAGKTEMVTIKRNGSVETRRVSILFYGNGQAMAGYPGLMLQNVQPPIHPNHIHMAKAARKKGVLDISPKGIVMARRQILFNRDMRQARVSRLHYAKGPDAALPVVVKREKIDKKKIRLFNKWLGLDC